MGFKNQPFSMNISGCITELVQCRAIVTM